MSVSTTPDGSITATLVSVPPRSTPIPSAALAELLAALGWPADDLDHALPPRAAYAGAGTPSSPPPAGNGSPTSTTTCPGSQTSMRS